MNPINRLRDWRLASLLRRAAAELRRRNSEDILTYTEFRTTFDFAVFLDEAAVRFSCGDTTDGERLWRLFAPTCDWDDAGGSTNLGNLIFGAIGNRFLPKTPVPPISRKR